MTSELGPAATAPEHHGACLCGATTFTVAGEPVGARICWCRDCQRIACGHGSVNVLWPDGAAQFAGALATHDHRADSGNKVERGFCQTCGSHLYSRSPGTTQPMRIRAGTLDDPARWPPTAVIWTASAPAWVTLPAGLPTWPGSPYA